MDDLISRQAAIRALNRIGSLDTEADRKYARSIFEALPSAEPERKNCKSCRYNAYEWDEEPCDSCTGVGNHWKPSAQPEIIRCKDCMHDNHCAIQYAARTGNTFFCGAAERREE